MAREGRQSGKDARTADERERVCTALPQFEDALAAGTVSAGHVDAIAGAIRNLDEPTTAEFVALGARSAERRRAGRVSICSTARVVISPGISTRSRPASPTPTSWTSNGQMSKVKRWTDRESGMRHTLISARPGP